MKNYFITSISVILLLSSCSKENTDSEVLNDKEVTLKNQSESLLQSTNQSLYYWANLMLKNTTFETSTYMNDSDFNPNQQNGIVTWSGSNGATTYRCSTDCSGLLNRLLIQTYGYTTSDFITLIGASRPRAKDYYDIINNSGPFIGNFTKITSVTNIRQGDIIAIKYLKDNLTTCPDNNITSTGHCMLVVSPPTLRTPTDPIIFNTDQYEVWVIDEAESGHGSNDTRYNSHDGIGKGVFRFYTDRRSGVIIGHTWSTFANGSGYKDNNCRPLVVGRHREFRPPQITSN